MEANKMSNKNISDGVIDFTSGSLGAVALVYVGQPLDTVKVKLQTFPHLYKGMWNCMHKTFVNEGVRRGLYAGTIPALAANVAENSVLFAAYGACQKFMTYITNTPSVEELSILSNASAGFLAAFFSSFSLCPTELIKIKMQAAKELAGKDLKINHAVTRENNEKLHQHNLAEETTDIQLSKVVSMIVEVGYYNGDLILDTATLNRSTKKLFRIERKTAYQLTKKIFREEGVRGLFKGLGPTMAREMPGYFFFFGGYEGTRYFLKPAGQSKEDCGPFVTMLAGAVGGAVLWSAVFPTDVVKSRVQLGNMEGSLLQNTVTIVKNEGESILSHVDLNDLSELIDDQLQQEIWTAPLELVDKISSLYVEGRLHNLYSYQKIVETTQRRVLALYSGLLPTLLRTIPSTAVLLLVYESSKHLLHSVIDVK